MAQTYQVKPGDSLSKIASQLGVNIADISGYASGNPNKIQVGENLTIGSKAMTSSQGAGAPVSDMGSIPMRNDMQDNGGAGYDSLLKADPSLLKPGPSLTRPAGMNDADWARMLSQSPFMVNDPNSSTGYRNPTGTDLSNFQRTYVPTLSKQESDAVLSKYGIKGLGNTDFTGMTASQAESAAKAKKQEILGASTLNSNNSYFQVTQLNNIKKGTDTLKTGLSALTNDPWKTTEDKKIATKDLLDKAASSYAGSFTNPQEFLTAYNGDPSFQAVMKDYIAAGGTVGDVAAKIATRSAPGVQGNQSVADYLGAGNGLKAISDQDNGDGTRTVQYNDGSSSIVKETINADGTSSYQELKGMGPGNSGNVFKDSADSFMQTDRVATIENIQRLAKVPQQYIDLYYGTPEKTGIFQKIKADAETSIKNLTEAYTNTKQTTSDQFDLQIQKNTYEGQAQQADIEEKRLQAKTYLTGRLAQLGALTTTGAAPEALANLDARYDAQKNASINTLRQSNSELMSKKKEAVNKLQEDLNTKVQSISSNLNKSEEEIQKDILTATNSTNDKIAAAVEKFNTQAASTYKTFLDVTNKAAKQYIQDYMKTASGGLSAKYLSQFKSAVADNTKPVKAKTPTKNPLSLTPTNKRDLQAAGLTNNTSEVQTYFLKTDPAFQKEWSRNVQMGQNKNPTIDNIHKSYTDWYEMTKKKKTNSGQKS